MTTPAFDQHLVDYTVRNISTGDGEEVRLLELTDDEAAGLPADVRAILDPLRHQFQADTVIPHPVWDTAQDSILALLRPYISRPALFDNDYTTWEQVVLENDQPLLEDYPPEHIKDAVHNLLLEAVDGALENWNEGFWAEFDVRMTAADTLRYFTGYIEALLDGNDEYERGLMHESDTTN